MLFCLCGVSGAGKNTLIDRVTKKWDISILPTATTRPMRPTEFQEHPYIFMTRKQFDRKMARGQFVETCEVHKGTMYGTLRSVLDQGTALGKILIKDMDIEGCRALKAAKVDVVTIFIKTSSLDVLKDRLKKRGEPDEAIEKRLSRAEKELAFIPEADYVVVNDDLGQATFDLEQILKVETEKRGHKLVLNNKKDYFVVYNKTAGKARSLHYARKICGKLSRFGDVELVESKSEEFINAYFANIVKQSGKDAVVVVVGGDGTLGTTVDALLKNKLKASVAVFPSGTANDFSRTIGMNKKIDKFVQLLEFGQPIAADVALCNKQIYSIHVVAVGNFGHGSMKFSTFGKRALGYFEYWLRCFFKAFTMKTQKVRIVIDGEELVDDFSFFFLSNGVVAGGFYNFAPDAQINDGCFDLVAFKKCKNIFVFGWQIFKLLLGVHKHSKHVMIKKGSKFHIECVGEPNKNWVKTDIDGNEGICLPLDVEVIKQKINIYAGKIKHTPKHQQKQN